MSKPSSDKRKAAMGNFMIYAEHGNDEELSRDARSGETYAFEAIMQRCNQRFLRLARCVPTVTAMPWTHFRMPICRLLHI